ncbi:MAG TPA: tetratricopeptide repeat protein [Bryobacteraceae bacterium]|nr:tetratricopeptide repeat protein [Bryobacteraceae bacterium]
MTAYVARDFDRAAECYHSALRIRPHDPPALLLMARCREFQKTPPPEHWDGVYVATEK